MSEKEEVEGTNIYQIPPELAGNPELLEGMGRPEPGGWYFAPSKSRVWDHSKSPFSKAYDSKENAVLGATAWRGRSKL